jgi:hypothetical protein
MITRIITVAAYMVCENAIYTICSIESMVLKMVKFSKYHNIKTKTSDGIEHDSMTEARRWSELKLLERANEIKDLQRQVKYVLIPAQYESYERYSKKGERLKDGVRLVERECAYIADFVYTDNRTGKIVVEDTKGVRTKDYIIKRKLLLYVHHIKIKEVK